MKRIFSIALLIALAFKAFAFGSSDGVVQKHWSCNSHQYPFNMTMIGIIQIDGEEQQSEYFEIGAFCGEECRGSELLAYYAAANKYLVFLTVYGSNNDVITFKLYDHQTETELALENQQETSFSANAFLGNPDEPYTFDFVSEISWLTVTANVLPEGTGNVNGYSNYSGTYQYGSNCTLQATPSSNYRFLYWMKDGVQISTSATYSFTVTEDANYSAYFVLSSSIDPYWTFNPYLYEHSMTMVGIVKVDDEEQRSPYLELGAFCGSECRGSVLMQYIPTLDRYFAFLTVYGNDGNTINFKLYDHNNWNLIDRMAPPFSFTTDTICGNPGEPYVFNFTSYLTIQATPNVTSAGTVTGAGNYFPGEWCTMMAIPNEGYVFLHWMENDEIISTNAEYSFSVTESRILRAIFCQELPELHVTSMSHSNFVASQTATVTWSVQNDGLAGTGSSYWYDRVFLSIGDHVTSGATGTYFLGSFTRPSSLEVGESYTQTQTVTIPESINGTYFLFVITDAYDASTIYWENNQMVLPYTPPPFIGARSSYYSSYYNRVFEMSEFLNDRNYHDNFFIQQVEIAIPLLPELHITSMSHSNLVSSQTATVTWTVQNDGEMGTGSSTWYDRVWLTLEDHVSSDALGTYLLGTFNNFASLEVGESYTQTKTVTIPESINGPYHLFVITDAYDAHTIYWENNQMVLPYTPPPFVGALSYSSYNKVFETSEYINGISYHDNFFVEAVDIAMPPLPDLQVTSIIAPNNFYSGTYVSVTATISNMGEAPTSVSHWTDALYISDSAAFGSNSQRLALVSHNGYITHGDSYEVTFNGYIPLTMYGSAYFYVQTDYYGQVYEHVMNNNNISRSEEVNIILTPPADLVPYLDSYTQNASTGANMIASFTVVNEGAGDPNYSSWYDHVYLSSNPDEIGDNAYLLASIRHDGNMQPNAEYTHSWTGPLPAGITAGTYYLYVYTDALDNVFEYLYNENNIVRSAPITVNFPDLQVIQLNAPDTLVACYPMNINYVVQNAGSGAIENWNVTDRFGLSTNINFTNAITISERATALNLQPGESTTLMINTALPNVEEDTYYLFMWADAENDLRESNENNNTLIKYPVFVEHQPLPDLQPLSLVLPSSINAGNEVNIEFDVTNLGELDLLDVNCDISLYATNGVDSILCVVQSQTLPLGGPNVSIPVGETVHFVRTVMVSSWVTSEYSTFLLVVDPQNQILEMDETNNVVSQNVTVINCPLPDLAISNISSVDGFQSGVANVINVTVANNGEAALENETLTFSVVAYQDDDTIVCPVQTQPFNDVNIAVYGSQTFEVSVFLPPMVLGNNPNIQFTVDPNETIHEMNHANNTTTYTGTVLSYPFDLQILSMDLPGEILAGREYTMTWTVKNNGTCPSATIPMYMNNNGQYVVVNGNYLPIPWIDKVFISDDNQVSEDDEQLVSFNRTMVLNPDATYTATQTFVVPFTVVGTKQMLCVADAMSNTYDNNRNNNQLAQSVNVSYGPLPDLRITAIDVENILESSNSYWIHYTVTNEGSESTLVNAWTDAFYLSNNATNTNNAYRLGSKIHNGLLQVGESYTDSIHLIIPYWLTGEYYFLGFTDATDQVFEDENEFDNIISTAVSVITPLPCDLLVSDLSFPAEAQSGEEVEVSWQLSNIGANPAKGYIKEAVYLSTDDVWSSDDIMLGSVEPYINIPANGTMARQLNVLIQGVTEGDYYVIVRTNIQHAMNEVNYENNSVISLTQLSVTYPLLAIGSSVDQTMANNQYIYYRIDVGEEYENQTLSCRLTTTSDLILNKLYMSFEEVPTLASFDFGASTPYEQELEILIPSLNRGRYYLLATGTESNGTPQNITLAASIVNFEILHVDTDHGSNAGSITTQIIGAKFDSIMDFRLVQGNQYLPAEKVFYSNSTESYATFNLKDMPAGDYGMVAELPGGIITIKNQAFVIEEGLPAELAVNIIAPSSVRTGSKFTANIEYGNYGSTDLNVSGFVVTCNYPIALQSDSLSLNQHELTFMTAEGQGNPDVLRPGYLGTKTIFVNATSTGNLRIKVYAIRRQY